jgi:SSS family solute:Na+ symporter
LGFSAFLLAANIFIDAAAALYAGAIIVQTLYPEIPVWLTVSIASLLAGAYIVAGGLRAVVLNDVIQAVMIIIGGAVVAVLALHQVPSWESVVQQVPPEKLSLIRPANDPVMPWPGILSGVLVIGIYFWCMNQFVMQRALAARNLDHGRWGALFAAFLKLPNLFLLVLPGIIAIRLYPDLASPDLVFPTLAFDLLPPGWRGLMLASLGAAILSSLEAILNSASTLFTMDFVKTLYPDTSDRDLVRTGKWATLFFMVAAAAWAPQIAYFPTLWTYLQSILSYVTPPTVAIFLLGLFWSRGNRHGAAWTLILGLSLGIAGWVANEILHVTKLQYLYACGMLFLLSCLVFIAVSLLTPAPDPETIRDTLWRSGYAEAGSRPSKTSPWNDYRYLSAVLLLLTCVIVAIWW